MTEEELADWYREDVINLHEVVTHLVKRLKSEILDGVVPEGQEPLLKKYDGAQLAQKLSNMLKRLFDMDINISTVHDSGSFSYILAKHSKG
ncbi:MAG: hypothetical protein K0R98_1528 [Rickettsiaceae bacterium]|nr:hypothetical protein [Rickettsiaceae bacterium]